MKYVNSISSPEKVFETSGSQPALILCNDLNHYVCKYNRWTGAAKKLFNEIIAGSFAQAWNLAIPKFNFINVNPSHIDDHSILQPSFFNIPCFGSLYSKHYIEIDEFFSELTYTTAKRRFGYKDEFLKIALFDIWLANEDRNFNNYNLLIDITNENRFVPIDHDAIFNTGNLEHGLVLLTEEESLLSTNLAKKLFIKKELTDQKYLTSIEEEYYICIAKCEQLLDNILSIIPVEWNIDNEKYKNLLTSNLFNKNWIDDCVAHFFELIQINQK